MYVGLKFYIHTPGLLRSTLLCRDGCLLLLARIIYCTLLGLGIEKAKPP